MKGLDGDRVRTALAKAQRGTTGKIGVRVAAEHVPDALQSARAHFQKARLHEHPDANGVLILVAPKSRKLAVYGGDAVHERLGEAFWKQLVADMTPHFAAGRPTEGLELGIARIGEHLRKHFPAPVHA